MGECDSSNLTIVQNTRDLVLSNRLIFVSFIFEYNKSYWYATENENLFPIELFSIKKNHQSFSLLMRESKTGLTSSCVFISHLYKELFITEWFAYVSNMISIAQDIIYDITNNAWVTANNEFWSWVRWFANAFYEWRSITHQNAQLFIHKNAYENIVWEFFSWD